MFCDMHATGVAVCLTHLLSLLCCTIGVVCVSVCVFSLDVLLCDVTVMAQWRLCVALLVGTLLFSSAALPPIVHNTPQESSNEPIVKRGPPRVREIQAQSLNRSTQSCYRTDRHHRQRRFRCIHRTLPAQAVSHEKRPQN